MEHCEIVLGVAILQVGLHKMFGLGLDIGQNVVMNEGRGLSRNEGFGGQQCGECLEKDRFDVEQSGVVGQGGGSLEEGPLF